MNDPLTVGEIIQRAGVAGVFLLVMPFFGVWKVLELVGDWLEET